MGVSCVKKGLSSNSMLILTEPFSLISHNYDLSRSCVYYFDSCV